MVFVVKLYEEINLAAVRCWKFNFCNATDTVSSIIRCSLSGDGRIDARRTHATHSTHFSLQCCHFLCHKPVWYFDKNWNRTPNLIYVCWCFLHLIFAKEAFAASTLPSTVAVNLIILEFIMITLSFHLTVFRKSIVYYINKLQMKFHGRLSASMTFVVYIFIEKQSHLMWLM